MIHFIRGTFTLCLDNTADYDFYEGAIEIPHQEPTGVRLMLNTLPLELLLIKMLQVVGIPIPIITGGLNLLQPVHL